MQSSVGVYVNVISVSEENIHEGFLGLVCLYKLSILVFARQHTKSCDQIKEGAVDVLLKAVLYYWYNNSNSYIVDTTTCVKCYKQ